MTDRLALPRRYRDQLEALLREHVPGVEVWAYGSRVNGRSYVGAEPQPDDGEPFEEKMARLTAQWREQQAGVRGFDAEIEGSLTRLGFD